MIKSQTGGVFFSGQLVSDFDHSEMPLLVVLWFFQINRVVAVLSRVTNLGTQNQSHGGFDLVFWGLTMMVVAVGLCFRQ